MIWTLQTCEHKILEIAPCQFNNGSGRLRCSNVICVDRDECKEYRINKGDTYTPADGGNVTSVHVGDTLKFGHVLRDICWAWSEYYKVPCLPWPWSVCYRDTMDSVKQSAALCLLRLHRTSPDLVTMGELTSRVAHLLNDQHLVWPAPQGDTERLGWGVVLIAAFGMVFYRKSVYMLAYALY